MDGINKKYKSNIIVVPQSQTLSEVNKFCLHKDTSY